MAFSNDRWRLFRDVGPWRAWYYEASGDTVTATGYFNEKWQDLRVNDVIYVETAADVPQYRVSAIAPNSVTVTSYGGGSGGGGGDAASVTFTPAGNLAATDVQAALEELDSEKAAASHTQAASTITDFTEASQDVIGAMITAAGGSYNDGAGTITLPSGGSADDWDRVDNATNPGATWTLSASTGHAWSYASVNANVQITLGSATVTGTANYLYYRRITVYNSSGGTITITLSGLTKRLGVTPSLSLETLGTFEIVGFTTDLGTTWLYDGDFDISKLTTKSTPVSGDFLLGMDSAASNVMKKFAAPLAGSETVAGLLELATTAEINTATDTGRPMAPDQFAASNFGLRYIMIPLTGLTSDDQATASPAAFGSVPIPAELNGYKVATTKVVQDTAGTTGASTYMPVRVRSGSASDLCTGNISVSSGTLSASGTVQTSGSADVLATDDLLRVNIVGLSTTKPKGGMCVIGVRPA